MDQGQSLTGSDIRSGAGLIAHVSLQQRGISHLPLPSNALSPRWNVTDGRGAKTDVARWRDAEGDREKKREREKTKHIMSILGTIRNRQKAKGDL